MKLKPCPFCGGEAKLKNLGIGTGGWLITCKCGSLMSTFARKAHDEPEIHKEIHKNVISAWNRREK